MRELDQALLLQLQLHARVQLVAVSHILVGVYEQLQAQRALVEHPRYELHLPLECQLHVGTIAHPVSYDCFQIAQYGVRPPCKEHVCDTSVKSVVKRYAVLLLQRCGVAATAMEYLHHPLVLQQ